VEFVVLAPLLLLLMLFVVGAGRVVEAHGQTDGAARDAARAASIARTLADANANALQAAQTDLNGWCNAGTLAVNVGGYAAGSPQVTVQVQCTINLKYVDFPNLQVSGTAVAPLDTFVSRTY
jgi:Flp pilus assembly protein TadG